MHLSHISADLFINRFISLTLGGRDLPKKRLDRHILFISSILGLDPGRKYTEAELNQVLQKWTTRFGGNFRLDHVTLRRFLVDERYLIRDSAGKSYERMTSDLPYSYDPSIEKLDLEELLNQAREARDLRKQQFSKRPQE